MKCLVSIITIFLLIFAQGICAQEGTEPQHEDINPTLDPVFQTGMKAFEESDYQTALEHWEAGLDQARDLEDTRYIMKFLSAIGSVYQAKGDMQQAVEFWQ
jgi:Tfp pilus assembly protein PilF